MLISKTIEIDTGHRVPNHKSKCRNLHGHRYVIEAGVEGDLVKQEGASDEGMVIDFSDLKAVMVEEIHDKYDHGFIMFRDDDFAGVFDTFVGQNIHFVPFIPTAENLAKFWFDSIKGRLLERGIKLVFVKVWETPTSTAIYQE